MKPTTNEMKKRVDEMPADQWFGVRDIAGKHNAGLWMHLCAMDDGKQRRQDGCVFVSDQTCTQFMWKSR